MMGKSNCAKKPTPMPPRPPPETQDLQAHSHPRSESPFCHAAAINGWLRLLAASAIRSTACSPLRPLSPPALKVYSFHVLRPWFPPSSSRPCCAVRGTAPSPQFDLDAGPIQEPG